MNKAIIAAAAIAVQALSASAVTVISNQTGAPDPGMPAGFTTVIDFDNPTPAGIDNITSPVGNVFTGSGSVGGQYAAPAGTTTNYQAVRSGGSSIFDFTDYLAAQDLPNHVLTGFSLYWGSIDLYNTLQFGRYTGSDFTVVSSFTGADFPPANGSQPANVTNRRITFGIDSGDAVNAVRFLSSQNAFEFDTIGITASVPEPASWAMLIAGFGLVGATMRRRRLQPGRVLA